ncbi:hypothetical protein AHAS_Ahas12G0045400 [Arachis hypogaea]
MLQEPCSDSMRTVVSRESTMMPKDLTRKSTQLQKMSKRQLPDLKIVVFDIYKALYDLVESPSKFGACCSATLFQIYDIGNGFGHFGDYTIAIMGYGPEDENAVLEKCPEPKCKGILEPQNCISIIPKEVFERWENALCENLVLATSKKFYCPFKNCSAMLVNDDGNEVVTCPECPHCHRLFCAQCKVAWHGGIKCGEFMSLNENEREGRSYGDESCKG